MIGSLEILESGVAFPGQTASWEIESCKHRRVKSLPFHFASKRNCRICHQRSAQNAARNSTYRRTLSTSIAIRNLAKLRGNSRVSRLCILQAIDSKYTWRRERDSNPRYPFRYNGFQDRRYQPLTHPSASDVHPRIYYRYLQNLLHSR